MTAYRALVTTQHLKKIVITCEKCLRSKHCYHKKRSLLENFSALLNGENLAEFKSAIFSIALNLNPIQGILQDIHDKITKKSEPLFFRQQSKTTIKHVKVLTGTTNCGGIQKTVVISDVIDFCDIQPECTQMQFRIRNFIDQKKNI